MKDKPVRKYSLAVIVGRCQIPHYGHINLIKTASMLADKILFIVGSSDSPMTLKNPFSTEERIEMLSGLSAGVDITYAALPDYTNIQGGYDSWLKHLKSIVDCHYNIDDEIVVVGTIKQDTEHYLKNMPYQLYVCDERLSSDGYKLSSSEMRASFFENEFGYIESNTSPTIVNWLKAFQKTDRYKTLTRMFEESWKFRAKANQYPRIEVACDAVVFDDNNNILLIQRKDNGLWAIPGGFLNPDEELYDCAVRELREETQIKVSDGDLRTSYMKHFCVSGVYRDHRSRIISHVYVFKIDGTPAVCAADDAKSAVWVDLNQIDQFDFHADHKQIIIDITG